MSVPADPQVIQCRYCPALIFFATTDALKRMPLEARSITVAAGKPRPPGLFVVPELRPGERQHRCTAAPREAQNEPAELFRAHWGQCPGRGRHTGDLHES